MARYSILSKPVLCTLPVLTALFASAIPAPAQSGPEPAKPPLMVPFRPLVQATDGFLQEGILIGQSLSAAGPDAWLTAHTYFTDSDVRQERKATTLIRMMRRAGASSAAFPLPEYPDFSSGYAHAIQTLPGSQGAWVLWQTTLGVKAWWISSLTGQPMGNPLLLPGGAGLLGFSVAGDGETGWIISRSLIGSSVATISASGGTPRMLGSSLFPFAQAGSYQSMMAASKGKLLLVQTSPASPLATKAVIVSTSASVSSPQSWPSGTLEPSDIGYGLMSYGDGWMAVYDRLVTPLLSGRIVMGQELLADGLPTAAPAQALFVGSPLGETPRHVISTPTRGIILTGLVPGNYVGGFGMILEKGSPARILSLAYLTPYRPGNATYLPTIPIAAALQGDQLALLRPEEDDDNGFAQKLDFYHTGTTPAPLPSPSISVAPAIGIQEEPALAWQAEYPVLTWQQISTVQEGPSIRQQIFRPRPQPPAELMLGQPTTFPLSSPDTAANGTRMLLVGRQPTLNSGYTDPDDVAGVLIENGQAISSTFKIGYGPGSQRAAGVARYRDGFCVVWREELNAETLDYSSRIRLAILDRNGLISPPGGYTIATSRNELSSPCVAVNNDTILVVWKNQFGFGTRIEATATYSGFGGFAVEVFPGISATSPDVIASGTGFLITARNQTAPNDNSLLAAEYQPNAIYAQPLPSPTAGLVPGREPSAAALADGSTALFWLNHRSNDRHSTQIWMAVQTSPGRPFGPPQLIQTGLFNRDTLTVKGDGNGRVLLSVKSLDPQQPGVLVFLLAPGVTEAPTLTLVSARNPGGPEIRLQWTPNLLFPRKSEIVEASPDLNHWSYVGGLLSLTPSPDGPYYSYQRNTAGPYYFRLRALSTGP